MKLTETKLATRRGHWSDTERTTLKEYYNVLPIADLEKKLNRTRSSITSQVNYLRKRGWTFKRTRDE